jgi:inhibitor of KinA sporulation pathway (predicted exonuclease)
MRQTRLQFQQAHGQASQAADSNATSAANKKITNKISLQTKLDLEVPPITDIQQAFKDLLSSKRLNELQAIAESGGLRFRVGTICSGTEAPIFALKLIREISQVLNFKSALVQFEHVFSVEKEPFKQAYISRNAPGSIIFRDVVDLADSEATKA